MLETMGKAKAATPATEDVRKTLVFVVIVMSFKDVKMQDTKLSNHRRQPPVSPAIPRHSQSMIHDRSLDPHLQSIDLHQKVGRR